VSLSREQALAVLRAADRLCSATEVSAAVTRMAREITAALADGFPLVLCVMRGGVVFAGQLLPQLPFPLELDYLEVTRYGDATRGGEISWRVTPDSAVRGRTVLVVDDILDEGITLAAICERLREAGASRVVTAVLAEKDTGRGKPIRADYVGIRLPNRFVFGCGMDVSGAWRNLPEIYAVKE